MIDLNYVRFVRQDAIHDIFSYTNCEGETEYLKFPRSMEMKVQDVIEYLND